MISRFHQQLRHGVRGYSLFPVFPDYLVKTLLVELAQPMAAGVLFGENHAEVRNEVRQRAGAQITLNAFKEPIQNTLD